MCARAAQQSWAKSTAYNKKIVIMDLLTDFIFGLWKLCCRFWFHFISVEFCSRLSRDSGAKWLFCAECEQSRSAFLLHKHWIQRWLFSKLAPRGLSCTEWAVIVPADALHKVFHPPVFLNIPEADKEKLLVISPRSFHTYRGALCHCPTARWPGAVVYTHGYSKTA